MFEHHMSGTQALPIRRQSREISPKVTTYANDESQQPQCPSPPSSATVSMPTETVHKPISPPDSVDSLAQELSKQKLELDRANLAQLQSQLSSPSISPPLSYLSHTSQCFELEIDHELQLEPDYQLGAPGPLSISTASSSGPMEVERRPPALDMRRLRRQQSSHFTNNPNNSRAMQSLVEDMIASGSQCNVHGGVSSPPPATPTSAKRLETILEPDIKMKLDVDCVGLEVDEAYANGSTSEPNNEDLFLLDTITSLRRAGTPAGIRKNGFLPYRASADAAMSCANVVRSRPRMRKRERKRTGRDSRASSIVTSAFSSPVIPPSLPDDSEVPSRPM